MLQIIFTTFMDEYFTCAPGAERYAYLHMKTLWIELHRLVCQVCLKELETRNSSCKIILSLFKSFNFSYEIYILVLSVWETSCMFKIQVKIEHCIVPGAALFLPKLLERLVNTNLIRLKYL